MHILLMPGNHPTRDRPAPGAKMGVHVEAYRAAGWKVGVVAPLQRVGPRAERPLLSKEPWIEYDEDGGVPVYRDYTWVLLNRLVLTRAPFARKWRVGIETLKATRPLLQVEFNMRMLRLGKQNPWDMFDIFDALGYEPRVVRTDKFVPTSLEQLLEQLRASGRASTDIYAFPK